MKALLGGDQQAFARVIDEWSPGMLRLARCYVSSEASAEDVVQEAWLGALRGLANFEGRSRLKTWVLRIVVNIGQDRGERERRAGPLFSPRVSAGPTVDPRSFNGGEDPTRGRGVRRPRPGRHCPRARRSRPRPTPSWVRPWPTCPGPSGP